MCKLTRLTLVKLFTLTPLGLDQSTKTQFPAILDIFVIIRRKRAYKHLIEAVLNDSIFRSDRTEKELECRKG